MLFFTTFVDHCIFLESIYTFRLTLQCLLLSRRALRVVLADNLRTFSKGGSTHKWNKLHHVWRKGQGLVLQLLQKWELTWVYHLPYSTEGLPWAHLLQAQTGEYRSSDLSAGILSSSYLGCLCCVWVQGLSRWGGPVTNPGFQVIWGDLVYSCHTLSWV